MKTLSLTATALLAFMSAAAAAPPDAIAEGYRYDDKVIVNPDGTRQLQFADEAGNTALIPCTVVLKAYKNSPAILNMERGMTFAKIDCTKDLN